MNITDSHLFKQLCTGLNNDGEASEGSCDSGDQDIDMLGVESVVRNAPLSFLRYSLTSTQCNWSDTTDSSFNLSNNRYISSQLYPDDGLDEDCMTLVSKVWSKQEEMTQNNSSKIIEKLSGKRLAFTRDNGRGSKGDPMDDDVSYLKTPSKEKSNTKRLPATQVRAVAATRCGFFVRPDTLKYTLRHSSLTPLLYLPPLGVCYPCAQQVFEEIALQLCLQAERAVLEAAVEDAVMFTVLSSITAAEEGDDSHFLAIEKALARKNVRWWGHELQSKTTAPNPNSPANSLQLPSSLAATSGTSGYVSKNLPFDCERDWFYQIEDGEQDIKPENITGSSAAHSTDIETPGSRAVVTEDPGTEGPVRSQLPIISPEPRYNRISGFASRQQRQSMRMSLSAAQMHNLMDITNSSQGDISEHIFYY